MKRITGWLLAVFLVLGMLFLIGCEPILQDSQEESQVESTAESVEESEEEVFITTGDGPFPNSITAINVDWYRGNITLVYDENGTNSMAETVNGTSEAMPLIWFIKSRTLYICFAQDDTVVPEGVTKDLVITVNTNVSLSGSSEIYTEEGNIVVDNGNYYGLRAVTMDGTLNITGSVQDLAAYTIGDDISVVINEGGYRALIGSEAGNIHAELPTEMELVMSTTSGNIDCAVSQGVKNTFIDTTSGNVNLFVYTQAGVCVKIQCPEENFTTDIPFEKGEITYDYGEGYSHINIESVSGKVFVGDVEKR